MNAPAAPRGLPRIGDLIDGKYRIDSLLGQGGMGAVFRASHVHTGRAVALKVIVPDFAADESFLKRFEREARAAGSLRHPNVVDVTDFGYASSPGGRLAYLVMELLDGCSLADVLRQQAGLPLSWSVDVLEQAGAGIEEAHRAGLLHRDLKPDNIWLEPNRQGGYTVKVLDFGLAKGAESAIVAQDGRAAGSPPSRSAGLNLPEASDEDEATRVRSAASASPPPADLTEEATTVRPAEGPVTPGSRLVDDGATLAGSIVGTPAYMSPEQCRGLSLTPSSDVYSLAVIAYRMLAGRLPFEGRAEAQLRAHASEAPPDLATLRPDLPQDASSLVMQALDKDPAARPRSAGAFAAMLSARVQPTSEFLQSALFLFLKHLRTFLAASLLWLSPAICLSTLTGLVGLVQLSDMPTLLPLIPPGLLVVVPQVLAILGVLALQGAVVPAVMQAIVAPLQPLDRRSLDRTFKNRMRAYVRAVLPLVGMLLVLLVWLFGIVMLSPVLIEPLRDTLRALPRPIAMTLFMAVIFPVMVGPVFLFRRSSFGAGLQFLGAVAMMEGRAGSTAVARSRMLAKASGRALRAVTAASFALGGAVGGGLSFVTLFLPRGMPEWTRGPVINPVVMSTLVVLAPFLAVVSALTYLRALKAAGESPDDVLRAFEREILPESHWTRAARERILTQIDATRV